MRTLLTILFVFAYSLCSCQVFWQGGGAPSGEVTTDATNWYFDATLGSDGNSGHDTDNPKQSIAELNTITLSPDDSVFFKRGEVWRDTNIICSNNGSVGQHIVYTSYGDGANPKIYGSQLITTWTNLSGNVWYKYDASLLDPTGEIGDRDANVFFQETDGSVTWGTTDILTEQISSLTAEYDWYMSTTDTFYIYSPTDPNTRYNGVEVPRRQTGIALNSKEYLTFENLDLKYTGFAGISETYPTGNLTGLIIKRDTIAYIGTKEGASAHGIFAVYNDMYIQYNNIHDCGRRGISMYNYSANDLSNIVIEYNTFYNGYHCTGPDIATSSSGTGDITDVYIRNNLIYDNPNKDGTTEDPRSEFISIIRRGGVLKKVFIYNNLLINSSNHGIYIEDNVDSTYIFNNHFYGLNQSIATNLYHISVYDNCTGIHIKNNIFYGNRDISSSYLVYEASNQDYNQIHANYNLYYRENAARYIIWSNPSGTYTMAQWATMKSDLGWESNSPTPANPLFVDPPTDLRVYVGSPVIDAGLDTSWYTVDYLGDAVGTPPNIGAYETPVDNYTEYTIWKNDTLNRFYTTGVPAFQTDIYFNEGGVITYGNEVVGANAVITGNIYDYHLDDGRLYINYDWIDTTGAAIAPLAGDTVRPVDVHGQLNVSGRYLRNESNDTIILRGYGVERQSDSWGYTRFSNLSYMQYVRDKHSAQVLRVTLPVEENRYSPYLDFYYADSVNRIADMKDFVNHCISAGIYVIINWHEFNPNQLGSALYFWGEMATTYDGIDNVIFEIYNEARGQYTWATHIKPYADAVIDAIRAIDVDESQIIIVGVDDYDADFSGVAASPITGHNNIMYGLHFYAYADQPGERATHTGYIVNNNLPIFMTEGGAMNYTGSAPFDLENWYDWYDWMDTMKISSAAWYLMDHLTVDNAMLIGSGSVGAGGFWSNSEIRQWGREAQYMMRGYDLTNHTTVHVPAGTSTVWDNLVAYYDFDEASGDLLDKVGSADGTLYGPTQGQTGKSGDCYLFDAINDSIGFGAAVFNSQTFTYAGWIKPTATGPVSSRTIIGWKTNGGPQFRVSDDDYLELLEQNISIIASTAPLTQDIWQHVAVTYNASGNYAFYVNGQLVLSGTNDKTLVFSSTTFGAKPDGEWFYGLIDELGIWNVVKSANEISEMYNSGAGKFYDP